MLTSYDTKILYKIYCEKVEEFKMYQFLNFINENHAHLKNMLSVNLIAGYKEKSYERILENFFSSNKNFSLKSFSLYLKAVDSDFSKAFEGIDINMLEEKNKTMFLKPTFISEVGFRLPISEEIYVGREFEMEYFDILMSRKYKNNVVIVGEPGIGKTAFVNHYSLTSEKEIWYIDLARLLSGTKYRGEFEQKMMSAIDEAIATETILFIDEIHILLGAGVTEGGISASNILKPYLTNPRLQVIGATTIEEFEKFMGDRALERRFNILFLNPLEKSHMNNIVNKISGTFNFSEEDPTIVDHVYNQLEKHMSYRAFPDKLIDFFDFYYTFMTKKGLTSSLLLVDRVLSFYLNGGNYERFK